MRLLSNRLQKTSKCGKSISDNLVPRVLFLPREKGPWERGCIDDTFSYRIVCHFFVVTKHLMTGHKGNSEFCFFRGEPERNIDVEGKQNSLFPEEPVIKCFVILPDSKIEKARKIERLPKPTCSIEKSR